MNGCHSRKMPSWEGVVKKAHRRPDMSSYYDRCYCSNVTSAITSFATLASDLIWNLLVINKATLL